jgi:beta-glucosidase
MKETGVACLVCLSSLTANAQTKNGQNGQSGNESNVSAEDRETMVNVLMRQMTLEEKAGQLNQFSVGEPTGPGTRRSAYESMIAAGQIGSLINATNAAQVNAFQHIAVEQSRLHIPLLFGLDVIHGFRTIFPVNLGLAASWDPSLVERVSRLAAEEASAEGIRWTFSPMVDIARDARWGRMAEGAGEDPYLGAAFAQAYIHGYQGARLNTPTSILACAKHFIGYGAAEGGRDYNTTDIPERLLRQVYAVPFHSSIEAKAATVMAAFNALNGIPASANSFTLNMLLRKEWKFAGFVVSDWSSVAELEAHGIASDGATAARKAFLAGVDMDMESGLYLTELPQLVRSGTVSVAKLDDAVGRVLRVKAALGLFEDPYARGSDGIEAPLPARSLALAREAAEESFVLLKNARPSESPLLPLQAKPGLRIALVGPLADSAQDMLGCWSAQGRASDVVTLRAALAERAAAQRMRLSYAKGADILGVDTSGFAQAVRISRRADVVLVALGERGDRTGEATSRAHLDLSGQQENLLKAVAATGKPIVLLLFSGRPLTIPWAAAHVPTIVAAWFPGVQAGPALVRLLFGEVGPSGHITATWPRAVGQEPLYYNALTTGRPLADALPGLDRFTSRYIDEPNTPLFPFGHGLSYTTFSYSMPSTDQDVLSAAAINHRSATITVRATVTNLGKREGTTVAQCYIRLTGTSVARPVRELKGFQRLHLEPGQSKTVEFKLGKDDLGFWSEDMQFRAEPGRLRVWIAGDSTSGVPAEVTVHK